MVGGLHPLFTVCLVYHLYLICASFVSVVRGVVRMSTLGGSRLVPACEDASRLLTRCWHGRALSFRLVRVDFGYGSLPSLPQNV